MPVACADVNANRAKAKLAVTDSNCFPFFIQDSPRLPPPASVAVPFRFICEIRMRRSRAGLNRSARAVPALSRTLLLDLSAFADANRDTVLPFANQYDT